MQYIQANIGRTTNKGEVLSDEDWEAFINEVKNDLSFFSDGDDLPFETHFGVGTWGGKEEESAHVSLLLERELEDVEVKLIKDFLAVTARTFEQDTIALILGSELVVADSELVVTEGVG